MHGGMVHQARDHFVIFLPMQIRITSYQRQGEHDSIQKGILIVMGSSHLGIWQRDAGSLGLRWEAFAYVSEADRATAMSLDELD